MTTVLVHPENIFNIEVYSRSTWFHLESCKKKKVCINYFDEQKNPECIFYKIFQKKTKTFKAICAVLNYSKPKIFFV